MATEEKEPAVSKQPTGSKNQSQSNNTSKGGNSSTLDTYMGTSVILYRDRPVIQYPSTFANDKGLPCKLSLRLEQQSGYIQCDKSIHIKGIPCTVEEQEEIYSLSLQ